MQNYKKLMGSISIVTASYAASRLLGFFREILLAKWTGVSGATDTLDLAFIIPDFLFYLSAGGYLAITLIPLMSSKSEEKLNNYFLSLLYGLSLVFILFSAIVFLFRYQLSEVLNVESPAFFIEVFTPIIFSQIFFFIGAILMSYQYLKENFLYASLAPLIYNSTIIFFGWINSSSPESTVKGFAIGTLVGSIIGHLIIQVIGASRSGLKYSFVPPQLRYLKEYLFISLPLVVGQSIAVIDEQLFRIFGSMLTVGSVATFRYARRIAILPVGIIAQAIGVASYPLLARLFKADEIEELVLLVRKQLSYLFLFNGAVMVFCLANAESIISIIYERGAFNSTNTLTVASIFSIVVFAILPWSMNQVLTRSYYVQKIFWFPVISGTVVSVLTTILLLVIDNRDAQTYALLITLSLFVYSIYLLINLKVKNIKILNPSLVKDVIKSCAILALSFFLSELLVFESTFIQLSTSFVSIVGLTFTFLVLLKFEYINITKRN